MAEATKAPSYMAQLLEALGWNEGTRIPLADAANQELENLLISRQNELQRLKEAYALQNKKCQDLDKYKLYVLTESQENTRLLFANKQQLEQEVKLRQLSCNEVDCLERSSAEHLKQIKDLNTRIDRFRSSVARLLKKADGLKSEVCGERGVLQEWRAALERSACDITALEQFSKQDTSIAKALNTKREKLKLEHDRVHDRLVQLVSNLSAEERACDRISTQVREGLEHRKQTMAMWTAAVENLRQRDADIRHIREDYALLEKEADNIAEQCREQQAFCDQQRGNNEEAARENMVLRQQLGQHRMAYQRIVDMNVSLDGELKSYEREMSSLRTMLEKLHIEKKYIIEEQQRKELQLQEMHSKLEALKGKVADSLDKTKTSEKRAKELEDILNEEERYASTLTTTQQRSMHCSFIEQQKLLALKNDEKLFHMQLKACTAVMCKLDSKQKQIEKNLQSQKETLYTVCYQVETVEARVSHMEGMQAEREGSAKLVEKENRLKEVCGLHAARVALLERHSARLVDDMRRLTRDLETKATFNTNMQSRLKSSMLAVEGGEKVLAGSRVAWRRARVEEALMRLRVAHASRAAAGLDDTGFNLDAQRLDIDAAMNERYVEINARQEMFSVQKRALVEDCGKLRCEIREREGRIEQLIKRYDIFIGSLGKDDSGQQLSVTYFKIKFAAERAELRERGAALDADIGRQEKDVSALEATLRVVHHAHSHFMHHISPLKDDTPEIEELNALTKQYYELRDELKLLNEHIVELERAVNDLASRLTLVQDKNKQLHSRRSESEQDLDESRDRVQRQEGHLQTAKDIVKHNAKRAKKLVDGIENWRTFQVAVWSRDYAEAAHSAVTCLLELCAAPHVCARLAALLAATELQRHVPKHQRRLHVLINKIINEMGAVQFISDVEVRDSVFSTSSESINSAVSTASGYTKRLAGFRRRLAAKVKESAFVDDIPELARRSTVSLRVITLGLDETKTFSEGVSESRNRLN